MAGNELRLPGPARTLQLRLRELRRARVRAPHPTVQDPPQVVVRGQAVEEAVAECDSVHAAVGEEGEDVNDDLGR